mmetsp:Transcript_2064/g.3147  ORF Transcript_2064/g.3147 Transcript_2064/m.3147 type:complete len:308 (-) Transcript_2064:193-1116(-)
MLKALLKAHPHAAKTKCPKRRETLLHCACRNKFSLKVISLLFEERPNAVKMKDSQGNTALHAACFGGASRDVIEFLLEKWPKAVEEQNIDGTTPLHLACLGASLEVVSFLLEKYPEAVKIQNNYGTTPLHYAGASLGKIKLLLKHWPAAARVANKKGDTPLHFVCGDDASMDVVSLLLQRHPAAVVQRNKDGITPIDRCFASHPYQDQWEKQKVVLLAVYQLQILDVFDKKDESQRAALRIIKKFVSIGWWGGVALVFDHSPLVIFKSFLNNVPTCAFPEVLSMMGNYCKAITLWYLLKERQDILNV